MEVLVKQKRAKAHFQLNSQAVRGLADDFGNQSLWDQVMFPFPLHLDYIDSDRPNAPPLPPSAVSGVALNI